MEDSTSREVGLHILLKAKLLLKMRNKAEYNMKLISSQNSEE